MLIVITIYFKFMDIWIDWMFWWHLGDQSADLMVWFWHRFVR
jgi:hypothetical protein